MSPNTQSTQKMRSNSSRIGLFGLLWLASTVTPALAQEAAPAPVVDHSQMGHEAPVTKDGPEKPRRVPDHSSMQGGSPPPDARDPHAYSGNQVRSATHFHGDQKFGSLLVDRFEHVRTRANDTSTTFDLQARYGGDYSRLVFKAEGDVANNEVHESRTELLWSRAVAAYWDVQAGVRYDGGEDSSRHWFAVGFQGLAPYWFELDATLYAGENGRTAFRLEAEYELLFTQRLILQPRLETNLYGKTDTALDRGKGLSDIAIGLRLRYEIRREFAPYIGVERVTRYGDTADLFRAAGKPTGETRLVAGLRLWF